MSPRRRAGLVGVAAVAGSWVLASGGVRWGELGLTEAVNAAPELVVDALAVVMQLGARPAILLVAVVAAVVGPTDWRRAVAVVVLAGGLAWAGAAVVKDIVERPRPAAYSTEIEVRGGSSSSGFPSSHTAVAAGALVGAALVTRADLRPAVAVAGLVGLGRMAVGVHLPLDVVGGLGLGVAVAAGVDAVVSRAAGGGRR